MTRDIDALTSSTLKHLRERWWDDAFTTFLSATLQPRAGSRILDVGCGTGMAEIGLSRLHLPQVQLVGVDLILDRVREALRATRDRNIRTGLAAADACSLPFPDATFDSTFCVAVLQHVGTPSRVVAELARVTRPGGRVLVVEPDNVARYLYSSSPLGTMAFEMATQFFGALASAKGDATDHGIGPRLPGLFLRHDIEPVGVQLFPVSVAHLGAPPPAVWETRRGAVQHATERAPDESLRRRGVDYLKLLEQYEHEAGRAGAGFVEIQSTLLFATTGLRK